MQLDFKLSSLQCFCIVWYGGECGVVVTRNGCEDKQLLSCFHWQKLALHYNTTTTMQEENYYVLLCQRGFTKQYYPGRHRWCVKRGRFIGRKPQSVTASSPSLMRPDTISGQTFIFFRQQAPFSLWNQPFQVSAIREKHFNSLTAWNVKDSVLVVWLSHFHFPI